MAKDVLSEAELRDTINAALEKVGAAWLMDDDDEASQSKAILHVAKSILAAAEPAIRAEERERCAASCDQMASRAMTLGSANNFMRCADTIRQLGAGSKGGG